MNKRIEKLVNNIPLMRDRLESLDYQIEEKECIIGNAPGRVIGWDVFARDKDTVVGIGSGLTLAAAYRQVFEQVSLHEAYEDLDKPSRSEILSWLRVCRVMLPMVSHPFPPKEIKDVCAHVDKMLNKIDGPKKISKKKK